MLLAVIAAIISYTANTSKAEVSYRYSTQRTTHTTHTTVHSYRYATEWHIRKTWYWQDRGHYPRTQTNYDDRHTKSVKYLKWLDNTWKHRQGHARYRTLHHPTIAHEDIWICIHGGEGAWDSNTGNGFYGGLQMTSPWGKGDYYVYRADLLTPYEQMYKAELGYKASGYSQSWLHGQWPNTSRACGL